MIDLAYRQRCMIIDICAIADCTKLSQQGLAELLQTDEITLARWVARKQYPAPEHVNHASKVLEILVRAQKANKDIPIWLYEATSSTGRSAFRCLAEGWYNTARYLAIAASSTVLKPIPCRITDDPWKIRREYIGGPLPPFDDD